MLGTWRSHEDYQAFVIQELSEIAHYDPSQLLVHQDAIFKLFILNLDPLRPLLAPLYSKAGRPAQHQPEIFRSLILFNHSGWSWNEWEHHLQHTRLLRVIIGMPDVRFPGVASHYDFINRVFPLDEAPATKETKKKPRKKLKKGEKLPAKNPGIVAKLVEKATSGRFLSKRPERLLQKIFADVCVKLSITLGLVATTLAISGDGTCIPTGASPYGQKICQCRESGQYHCDCPRRFSDPHATWGWDSHLQQYFYGYTGYFLSTYNKEKKLDLPLLIRIVEAKRHDSVSAIVVLTEFRELYPDLHMDTFISDSASDNYATYELLHHWDISAVIALNSTNKANRKFSAPISVNEQGVPICPASHPMVYSGFCGKDRCRVKWRCPLVLGKVPEVEACKTCSPSPYGRTIYTKPEWDLLLYCRIPRGTKAWRDKMKQRTAAERVNNRIMNHYGMEDTKHRGKKRISFFTTMAPFNIHLDAQVDALQSSKIFDWFHALVQSAVA